MDNSLIFRLRTLKCTKLVLECQLRSLQQFKEPNQEQMRQKIIVRFMPFERKLINDLAHACLEPGVLQQAAHPATNDLDFVARVLFFRWSWASDVYRQILTDLNPFDVAEDHNGSQAEAFEMAMTMVRNTIDTSSDDQRFSRTKQFITDNQQFIDALEHVDREMIDAVPREDDELVWRLLAVMFQEDYKTIGYWPGFSGVVDQPKSNELESEAIGQDALLDHAGAEDHVGQLPDLADAVPEAPTEDPLEEDAQNQVDQLMDVTNIWNVWEFCRMYRLAKQRPQNSDSISPMLSSDVFQKSWKLINIAGESDDSWQGIFPREKYEGEQLSSIMGDFFTENRLGRLTIAYRRRLHEHSLLDPSFYLEFIPWSELIPVTDVVAVEEAYTDLGLGVEAGDSSSFVSWLTGDPQAVISHNFYINEDIYAYNVLDDFQFPGYLLGGRPLFRCRELGTTKFCEQLRRFWSSWNDCAITQNPNNGSWLLLETLPGVQARSLYGKYGAKAVRTFFGSLVVQHKKGYRHNPRMLQELLGPAYDSSYKNFLRYVDPSELQLDKSEPIGEGSFGRVYKCVWTDKPPQRSVIDDFAPGEVALKIAFGSRQAGDAKFFEELRLVHSALAGANMGFVEFLGFTKIFIDSYGRLSQVGPTSSAVFALVFDFASEGTILDHLSNILVPGQASQNWEIICDVLNGVSSGLRELHGHDVVHRDLHPNNVLVQKEYFKNSNSIGYHYDLADLGEGKSIESSLKDVTRLSGTQSFGILEYQAPEVATEGYGPATDMYAFGRLAIDMVRFNHQCFVEDDQGTIRIPGKLADILELCLDDDPAERLEAVLVGFMLEEVQQNIRDGEAEWVDSEEFLSRPSAGSKLLSLASTIRSSPMNQRSELIDQAGSST